MSRNRDRERRDLEDAEFGSWFAIIGSLVGTLVIFVYSLIEFVMGGLK